MIYKFILHITIILSVLFSAELENSGINNIGSRNDTRITDPMSDRAKGFALSGKAKTAVSNYGNFINWDFHPAGLWGEYTYIPTLSFLAGVPGHDYSSKYTWVDCSDELSLDIIGLLLWCSSDFDFSNSGYQTVVFDTWDDRGVIGEQVVSKEDIQNINQWGYNENEGEVFLSVSDGLDPNLASSRIGMAFPWSIRPSLQERTDDYDVYEYGPDQEEWTEDDDYMYYGANTAESWFTRFNPDVNTDWHATTDARMYTHNTDITAGDMFGSTVFTDSNDSYPLLAHSIYPTTWPEQYNPDTGEFELFWPGFYASDYYGDQPELWNELGLNSCDGIIYDDDCWLESDWRHISDTDIYMEFDDRWAHRGNLVENNQYQQTGYPLGIQVEAQSLSYGYQSAEDILFFIMKIRNESDSMIMPDETYLNRGSGFNYKNMSLGFYMDADVLTADLNGNFNFHTNSDDLMEYYYESFDYLGNTFYVSMALIYDYNGYSGGADEVGYVGVQLLDTPKATSPIDLDGDGIIDIYPGEELKMTDWHWFNWYTRPGVVSEESSSNCCAGDPGRPQALNKEEIMYKLMIGDTTNLSNDEKEWFFHTSNPDLDLDSELNPHFDSLEGILEEPAFLNGNDGLDCVFQMSTGTFDLPVGDEVPFSFAVIFGEDKQDLIENAKFSQIMYRNKYQLNPNHQMGDVTFDGEVDILDIMILVQLVLGDNVNPIVYAYGDLNGDSIYNIQDIISIIGLILD